MKALIKANLDRTLVIVGAEQSQTFGPSLTGL